MRKYPTASCCISLSVDTSSDSASVQLASISAHLCNHHQHQGEARNGMVRQGSQAAILSSCAISLSSFHRAAHIYTRQLRDRPVHIFHFRFHSGQVFLCLAILVSLPAIVAILAISAFPCHAMPCLALPCAESSRVLAASLFQHAAARCLFYLMDTYTYRGPRSDCCCCS